MVCEPKSTHGIGELGWGRRFKGDDVSAHHPYESNTETIVRTHLMAYFLLFQPHVLLIKSFKVLEKLIMITALAKALNTIMRTHVSDEVRTPSNIFSQQFDFLSLHRTSARTHTLAHITTDLEGVHEFWVSA